MLCWKCVIFYPLIRSRRVRPVTLQLHLIQEPLKDRMADPPPPLPLLLPYRSRCSGGKPVWGKRRNVLVHEKFLVCSIREFRVIRRSSPGLARVSCYSFWAILFHQESRSTVSNYLIGSIFVDKQEPNFAFDVKHIFNILYEFGKARTFVHLSSLNRISLSFCLT